MISIKLDRETETYLAEIITQENTTSEELLKKLIYQHWQTIKPLQTLAQRRGKHPENLLQDAAPNLSLRENRKKDVAEHIKNRHQKYHQGMIILLLFLLIAVFYLLTTAHKIIIIHPFVTFLNNVQVN